MENSWTKLESLLLEKLENKNMVFNDHKIADKIVELMKKDGARDISIRMMESVSRDIKRLCGS